MYKPYLVPQTMTQKDHLTENIPMFIICSTDSQPLVEKGTIMYT